MNPATDERRPGRVRVIASTTSSLETDVESGRFHRGLYDYLNVAPIRIPPLRERPQDIDALARHFWERLRPVRGGKSVRNQLELSEEVLELARRYRWPGNARELASVMARAMLAKTGIGAESSIRDYLRASTVPRETGEMISVPLVGDLKAIERQVIREVVRRHRGNKAAAARALGMHRRSLYRALEN
jgi:transcriptional regulator with PAS, ATPase and Fis domain